MDLRDGNFIRIGASELDTPIYRIYGIERFKNLLASGMDALLSPGKWDDPFENFILARTNVDTGTGLATLSSLAGDWYGQCWSTKPESDAMWRIYSAAHDGIKVKTTIRRLIDNLKAVGSPAPYLQFFIGRVAYMDEGALTAWASKLTFQQLTWGGSGDAFADLLCVKRDTFSHEEEVRLLFQDDDLPRAKGGVFPYPLSANILFDEAVIDPRLDSVQADRLMQDIRSWGFANRIHRSTLYDAPSFTIPLQ